MCALTRSALHRTRCALLPPASAHTALVVGEHERDLHEVRQRRLLLVAEEELQQGGEDPLACCRATHGTPRELAHMRSVRDAMCTGRHKPVRYRGPPGPLDERYKAGGVAG